MVVKGGFMPAQSGSRKPSLPVVVFMWLCAAGVFYGAFHEIFIQHGRAWWWPALTVVGVLALAIKYTRQQFRESVGSK
jgi:hypothetical protein